MPKSSLGHHHHDHTNPLIWCAAIICAVLAIVVIIAGIIIILGYLTIRPKVPQISVANAQLDTIYFDQTSLLTLQISLVISAENGNAKATATFYDTSFVLGFRGRRLAVLRADPFRVNASSSLGLNFVSQSRPIPLTPEEAEAVNLSLRRNVVSFELQGTTRTRWRVGLIGSVKFWLHLHCDLHLPVGGTRVYPRCSSKSR